MALNYVWIAFFIVGFAVGIIKAFVFGQTGLVSEMQTALFDAAKNGFQISLGLTGIMTLWLGIMKIGEKAGVISLFAKAVSPLFKTLFKGIPKESPA